MKLKDGRQSHKGQHPTHFALEKLSDDERVALNSCARYSFRDQADKDYIAARAVYRLDCTQQFLWLSEQAIEKYLKAILLFNFVDTREVNHNLEKGLQKVQNIPDLPISLPRESEDFIGHLNRVGKNRYMIHPSMQPGNALHQLDRAVWHIRKWCFFMRGLSTKGHDGKRISFFAAFLHDLRLQYLEEYPHRYRITFGHLEKVVKEKLPGYNELIWKNFYYGKRAKRKFRFEYRSHFQNPSHEVLPEQFSILEQYVYFPPPVANYYTERANEAAESNASS